MTLALAALLGSAWLGPLPARAADPADPASGVAGLCTDCPAEGRFLPVLIDGFDGPLSRREDGHGVWSTRPRRQLLATNGKNSVFLDGRDWPASEAAPIDPFRIEEGVLHIDSGAVPADRLGAVGRLLRDVGQEKVTPEWYTGMIATDQSWAQAYGYYEITARIPRGKGFWPAFWLAPAGLGWPPEIDIFEAYGRGIGKKTGKDDMFHVATWFDATDIHGNDVHETDLTNPYHAGPDGLPQAPLVKGKKGRAQYRLGAEINARTELGADIYGGFWTWGMAWTPETISYYFGPDRASLREIYRTPTPDDLHSPMYAIVNNQIGAAWGWNPQPKEAAELFAPENAFAIDQVSIYALLPGPTARAEGGWLVDGPGATLLRDGPGDDVIVPGGGADVVMLGGGADTVMLGRDLHNTIIEGFGADDRLVLEGFALDGPQEALARLTQVGGDVWLANGADPADPQTVLFRNARAETFTAENFTILWPVTPDIWTASRRLPQDRLADEDGDGRLAARDGGDRLTDARAAPKGQAAELTGSAGGDGYFIYRPTTLIAEAAQGGVDTVTAYVDYTLPEHIEVLAAGRPGLHLRGNGQDNRITGSPGPDRLETGGGHDLVDLTAGGRDRVLAGPGETVIEGFGPDDLLTLSVPAPADLAAALAPTREGTRLDLGAAGAVIFRGLPPEALDAAQIVFRD